MENWTRIKTKKRILVGIVAFLIFSIIVVLASVLAGLSEQENTVPSDYVYRYSDNPLKYVVLDVDTTTDIMAHEPYLRCDRFIYYSTGNERIGYTVEDIKGLTGDLGFWGRYFSSLFDGDAEAHSALFLSEDYRKEHLPEAFSRQMLYDIKIEYFGAIGDIHYYSVSYCIFENDGSYRNDIDGESSRPLYFELLDDGSSYKIKNIYTSSLGFEALYTE